MGIIGLLIGIVIAKEIFIPSKKYYIYGHKNSETKESLIKISEIPLQIGDKLDISNGWGKMIEYTISKVTTEYV